MYLVQVSSFLALFAAILVTEAAADGPEGRLFDGQPVDSLRQFPHHVYITIPDSGQRCGGTTLNDRWILTSASCVNNAIRVDLNFRKKQQFDALGDFFIISVNRDQVFVYPTNHDDIALIKLPTTLVFSESLSPLNISKLPIEALRDRFAVMPGFSDFLYSTSTRTTIIIGPPSPSGTSDIPMPATPGPTPPVTETYPPTVEYFAAGNMGDILKYGMFSVIDSRVCKKKLGSDFDEYTQLCVDSWGDNPNRPCDSDYGSGLVVGWPAKSELVGLFSMSSPGCYSNLPSVFTFIGKYTGWIESMIRG